MLRANLWSPIFIVFTCLTTVIPSLYAQTVAAQVSGNSAADPSSQPVTIEKDVVSYPAGFFSRFRPDSALDMLNQLPGFRLNFGGVLRGYGSDTGNVLIDGRRPSSKRVTVPSILVRIPASQVVIDCDHVNALGCQ